MPSEADSSAPLTVAMLAPSRERCGIGDYTRRLVSALRDLPEIAAVQAVSTPEDPVRSGVASALKYFLSDEKRYYALGDQLNSADVAHIQHQYFFFGGVAPHKNHFAALLNAVRVPVVLTVHEIAEGGTVGWRRALIDYTNRHNFLHPAVRQVIVHTKADSLRLQRIGVAPSRLSVLPLAVPQPLSLPDRTKAKEALGVSGKRVLMIFGFLSTKKGHPLALQALRSLPPDVVLILAGERHPDDPSDYVDRLNDSITTLGLHDRVILTGYLPEDRIALVMAATDLALAPFLESSGSASLAHLLAYRLPVLASDIPPHRELLAQTPGSLQLFPTGEAGALAEQILQLLDDKTALRALQIAAAQYGADRSFSSVARATVNVYRQASKD